MFRHLDPKGRPSVSRIMPFHTGIILLALCGSCLLPLSWPTRAAAQGQRPRMGANRPDTLGLEQGTMEIDTPDFTLKLVKTSQTAAALLPKGGQSFDFTPSDQLSRRWGDGFYHLGDLT